MSFLQILDHLRFVILSDDIFDGLEQLSNITKPEKSFYETLSVKLFQVIEMFSQTNKSDRTFSGCNRAQGTTTFCVSIKFGNDYTTHIDCLSEGLSLIKTGLTNRTIHDEDNVVWLYRGFHLLHFVEKLAFLSVSS